MEKELQDLKTKVKELEKSTKALAEVVDKTLQNQMVISEYLESEHGLKNVYIIMDIPKPYFVYYNSSLLV
jgi:hypothetical protein